MLNKVAREQRRLRIRVAIHACAYECFNEPFISDAEYDYLAKKINVKLFTDNKDLDIFFKENYSAHTGQWIWKHPQLTKIKNITGNLLEITRNNHAEE